MKLKIGDRKLMIETGRYDQIPRVNRLCSTCGSNHLPNIKRLSTFEVTKELMNSDNYFVSIQLMRFILSCLNFRNNLLSIQTDVT